MFVLASTGRILQRKTTINRSEERIEKDLASNNDISVFTMNVQVVKLVPNLSVHNFTLNLVTQMLITTYSMKQKTVLRPTFLQRLLLNISGPM